MSVFCLLGGNVSALKLPSVDFLTRGLKHCTGYCDKSTIKCDKGKNVHGYYDWCKKNCLGAKKTNRNLFVSAIAYCDNSNGPEMPADSTSTPHKDALSQFSKNFLGKAVEGEVKYGFKVEIIAQKNSGDKAMSGEFVYLHPDKVPSGAKIGSYFDIEKIRNKKVPAYTFGRLKMITGKPILIK